MSLRAQGVEFGYGRRVVLRGVDLTVGKGEVVGLLGPNGAGKSTLVRLLSGVERPARGEVTLDDVPLSRLPRRKVARRVAVAQQAGELPAGFTVEEIVTMGRAPHLALLAREGPRDRQIVTWAMEETGVLQLRSRRAGELSGGERQRVVLARALAQEPEFLLLDEPTAHLDLHFQVEVLRLVRQLSGSELGVLIVLHDLNLAARACDRLALLSEGKVEATGGPEQVLDEALLSRVYGGNLELLRRKGSPPTLLPRI